MARMKLYLLGPPHLEIDERSVTLRLRKAMALLIYLAVTRQVHTRDILATMFWPESSQTAGRASLRRTLHRLTQSIGEGFLDVFADRIQIDYRAEIWTDVAAFETLTRDRIRDERHSPTLDAQDRRAFVEAATVYAGHFLAGFTLSDCPQFDEWQFFRQEELAQALKRVLGRLAESDALNNRPQEALNFARRAMVLDPVDETGQRRLMQLYFQTGQKTAAIRQFNACVQTLKIQLGAAPQPETSALYDRIRAAAAPDQPAEHLRRPKTRYTQSGDVYIAYQVLGEGPVDLVFVSGFISHLEHIWSQPDLSYFYRSLASRYRLILFDKRGVGLSDRVGYPPGLEHTRQDIQAVMASAGSRKAILFGASEGGPAILTFARTCADLVRGIVLYGTMAKGVRSNGYPYALTNDQYDRWLEVMLGAWGSPVGIEYFAPSRADDPDLRKWWAELLRLGSSPGSVRMVLEVLRGIDVRPILADIDRPTLVLHRRDDLAIKAGAGRYLASRIPGARYVELPGRDHWWWVGDKDIILEEVDRFAARL